MLGVIYLYACLLSALSSAAAFIRFNLNQTNNINRNSGLNPWTTRLCFVKETALNMSSTAITLPSFERVSLESYHDFKNVSLNEIETILDLQSLDSAVAGALLHSGSSVSNNASEYSPLRFNFVGYSVWLEVQEFNNDVSTIIDEYAKRKGILPIPRPHVTAIYGMDHLTEDNIRARFKEFVTKQRFGSWPSLKPTGVYVDVEVVGVEGGLMVRSMPSRI
mmetsp:Transcript_12297/g.17706  ORF Transcript_12297/g.17706 Transcript_12297/m.17706 type:complete len:220 (-) Transcript_12297:436-1095(-)